MKSVCRGVGGVVFDLSGRGGAAAPSLASTSAAAIRQLLLICRETFYSMFIHMLQRGTKEPLDSQ